MANEVRAIHVARTRRRRELGRASYHAQQVGDEVIVTARGETPTPNYKVYLAPSADESQPPNLELWWMHPPGYQLQVLTPFHVHLTFDADGRRLEHVQVHDADGVHQVPVEQFEHAMPGPVVPQKLPANSFRLMLGRVPVTYASTSLVGEPLFSYGGQHFMGDEIRILDSDIGQQVTVVLEQIPDLKVMTFTLVVPLVLLEGSKPARVSLPGITATHHTTIAGPPLGQTISYEHHTLRGFAEFIVA